MNKTFDQSKDEIAKLCRYFANNRQAFLAPGVKEAHIRQSLIDPFFEALGWDMGNAGMAAPQYREVITEDSLDIEGQQKAPDYTFRVGTLAKFYVEAKKCGVNINADMGPAYQLRRYGFSARLPLSILTDFEELGVYDCAARPRPGDKASHGRIQYFGFAEYPDRWQEIWDVFSREAVWSGTFDQYAASKRKRGTSEVDSEFLKDIEVWRDVLARNLALRNNDLSADNLNAAVQKIIDRIIFLRMAEDRGLESYGQLHKLCEQPDIYGRFMDKLCRKADQKYNSGLFHFEKEPGVSEAPDSLTPDLAVDDNVLKPILQSLYFEHGCPYHFGVLPVEILGTVYERFLGKVIRLTAGHQAKVEEKPEVRKAGGVYYTPAYIVNYIVSNTIGKQVEGKSPADLAGSKTKPPFRVLDMACGSGSFLLGAYQFLLDHCLQWYQDNPSKKHASAVYQNAKSETRLTIAERKRILTSHIFGVDIDRQAVETTKLSLLLKALEGENDTSLSKQMQLFHERALPNLSSNIKCGNSLIGSDYFSGQILPNPKELRDVNPFDWAAEFSNAMKAGGFDCIIGNPPYGAELSNDQKAYFHKLFTGESKSLDTYELFLLQSKRKLQRNGRISMIIPASWLTGEKYESSRRKLVNELFPVSAYALPFNVFKDAYIDTAIIVLTSAVSDNCLVHFFPKKEQLTVISDNIGSLVPITSIRKDSLCRLSMMLSKQTAPVLEKVNVPNVQFSDWFVISRGVQPYSRNKHTEQQIQSRFLHANSRINKQYMPELQGNELSRYYIAPERTSFLKNNEEIASSRQIQLFEGKRITLRRLLTRKFRLQASLAIETMITTDNVLNMIPKMDGICIEFALGILNSKLISWVYVNTSMIAQKDDFPQVHISALSKIHLPKSEKAQQNKIADLVEQMLDLHKRKIKAIDSSGQERLQRLIDSMDKQIDNLVYEMYCLTEKEIKIVEDGTKK
jgi:hypothetical protein